MYGHCLALYGRDTSAWNLQSCFDTVSREFEANSEFMKWTKEDGRPEKVGEYRMFTKLSLDPKKATGHKIFRVQGWQIALIVEEEVKESLEQRKASGIVFQVVT